MYCCRIFPFDLLLLAAYKVSTCFLVSADGMEIFSTQSLTLLTACFCVFAMGECALLKRRYYRLVANWVLLLFPSVFLFVVNLLMVHFGYYRPLYSYAAIAEFRAAVPIIFFARLTCLLLLAMSLLFALAMVVNALFFYRWYQANRPTAGYMFPRRVAVQISTIWTVLMLSGFVPLFFGSVWLHIVFNLFFFVTLALSAYICRVGITGMKAQILGADPAALVNLRLAELLDMEQGGCTSWGVVVRRNPFFCGKSCIGDVAEALGVRSEDVSAYVSARGVCLAAWMSEQRLLHCAQQVYETDRKIAEIAIGCGYNDLPTFTRAFKRKFGMAPSEYRQRHASKFHSS